MPSYPIVGVPVDRLRKADPVTALKLTVVLGPDPMLDAAPLWAAGQIVQALKQRHGELEVAQLFLSSYRLLPDVSNDPNHSAFSPEDEFPAVWRALQESDIVLVGARECCGFPDHRNVLLLEKLDLHSQNRAREGHSEVLFMRRFAANFPKAIGEYEALITDNPIFRRRTQGVGVIAAEKAIDYGLSGPSLRGSGVGWDLPKAEPYAAYADLDFEVPVGERGDVFDRYLVRMEEMRQSLRLVEQTAENLPGGPVLASAPQYLRPSRGVRLSSS